MAYVASLRKRLDEHIAVTKKLAEKQDEERTSVKEEKADRKRRGRVAAKRRAKAQPQEEEERTRAARAAEERADLEQQEAAERASEAQPQEKERDVQMKKILTTQSSTESRKRHGSVVELPLPEKVRKIEVKGGSPRIVPGRSRKHVESPSADEAERGVIDNADSVDKREEAAKRHPSPSLDMGWNKRCERCLCTNKECMPRPGRYAFSIFLFFVFLFSNTALLQ